MNKIPKEPASVRKERIALSKCTSEKVIPNKKNLPYSRKKKHKNKIDPQ